MNDKRSYLPSTELILDYVDGFLDSERVEQLRKKEESDEFFKGVVDGVRYLSQQGKSREEIESYLQTLSQAQIPVKTKAKKWIPYSIAASIIIVLSFVGYLWFAPESLEDIVTEEIAIVYSPPTTTRDISNLNEDFIQATIYYQNENFEDAVIHFSKVVKTEPDNITSKFYLGLSYLYLPNPIYEEAQENLEAVGNSDNLFSSRAMWFLALIYIQQGQQEDAIPLLENVVTQKSFKAKKAELLLGKL